METYLILAVRIIPTILNRNSQMVKGQGFKSDRVVGHALQASRIYGLRGVDELIILDIAATDDDREPDYEGIKSLSDSFFSPLTVGGGIKTEEHVTKMLRSGADKVAICTIALEKPQLIHRLSRKFGKQCIVVAIDVFHGQVHSNSGSKRWNKTPVEWAKEIESLGAGEIILTSIERDGLMSGYDLELISQISKAVNIPVIAAGGCGTPEHVLEAVNAGADAVAISAMFQFKEHTPKSIAQYLHNNNVEVRL